MSDDLIERLRRKADAEEDNYLHGGGTNIFFPLLDEAADALAAKDTAISEMRAELERVKAERNGWQRIVGQIVGEVPLPDIVRVSGTARDLIKFFKDQREELDRVKKALEPFAKYMESGSFDLDNNNNPQPDEQGVGWVYLTVGDFRAAARALSQDEPADLGVGG